MRVPDSNFLSTILSSTETPCVSIYLPTHRANGNAHGSLTDQENHGRFRNLTDRAVEILTKTHAGSVATKIAKQLHKLRDDEVFWGRVQDGVVVLASPERFDAFTLPRTVPEFVKVGDSFSVKPLLRFVQSAEPFHVLGLSRERVALFHGNRYELQLLRVAGIPLTLIEALGDETDEPVRELHTGGPRGDGRKGGAHGATIYHGQESRKDEVLTDVHRYFQVVDRKVISLVSEPTGLTLIPVGIEENLAMFRAVTKNRFASSDAVTGDWTNWSLHEIREKAWKVFEKHYLARLAKIREDFGTAVAQGRGTGELVEAAKAATTGRVGVLLIDADRAIPGTIDAVTGELRPDVASAATGDMLDDLAEMGLRTKAQVIVTPASQMPTKSGLAAIYRY